jgi:hypothetical protein
VRSAPPIISRHWSAAPPDWVGVGVQRAGTSWWHSMIEAHFDVHALGWVSKELHYFDRFDHDAFGPEDVTAYHRRFIRPPGKQCGEWTPRYLYDPWTPALLRQAAPQARLLVMLRDPLARFESGLSHDIEGGQPLERAWAGAFARGLYHRQLLHLLDHYPRQQVLVLQFERCIDDPLPMLERTFEFLGLAPERFPRRQTPSAANRRRGPPVDLTAAQREKLRRDYEDDVRRLLAAFPDLDGDRWTNFRNLT